MLFLLKGFVVGFVVAAPVGPVGLLTIRRSLSYGRVVGFVTGMGAAVADGIFCAVAAFGLTSVTHFITSHVSSLRLIGGLAMVLIGIQAARSQPPLQPAHTPELPNLWTAFISTLAITLTNPVTIMGFIAVFSSLSQHPHDFSTALQLTLGVFLGSGAWWLLLSFGTGWFGGRLDASSLRWINVVAGVAIAILGAWQLAKIAFPEFS